MSKAKKVNPKREKQRWNIFHADADERWIQVFGVERTISPTKLKGRVVILKFPKVGKPIEEIYETNIKSIDVWMMVENGEK